MKALGKILFYIFGGVLLLLTLGSIEIYLGKEWKFVFMAIVIYLLIRKEIKENSC